MALPKLIVILGTTACGKSGLGVDLARHVGGEIVSADSRQVYRGLDLGTGKVTEEEMAGVPHHLLDIVAPNENYSVAEFQRDAYAAIDGILARGRVPLLVGGTGLYVRAVTEGYTFSDSQPDPALRAELEQKTTDELYAMFCAQTGRTLSGGEEKNRHRLVRTLEKLLSGAPLTETPRVPRYEVLQLGMTYPREILCRRIDERLQKRLDDGMVEEVARLRARGPQTLFWKDWVWSTATSSGTSPERSPPGRPCSTNWAGPSSALPNGRWSGSKRTGTSSGWTPPGTRWQRLSRPPTPSSPRPDPSEHTLAPLDGAW